MVDRDACIARKATSGLVCEEQGVTPGALLLEYLTTVHCGQHFIPIVPQSGHSVKSL
jgi:hypothetical protein